MLDLDAYLERIGLDGRPSRSALCPRLLPAPRVVQTERSPLIVVAIQLMAGWGLFDLTALASELPDPL